MKNGLKTAVLLATLTGLILVLGSLWGRGGLIIAFVISLALVGGSYWFSDTLAIRSARAVEVQPGQLPEYHGIMTELTQAMGVPMPRLYISPESQPNAFATGRNPAHAAVCVTEGLLHRLSWDEIRGVLAHELAHIRNRDVLIASVAATIATTIAFVANMMQWAAFFGGGSRDDDEGSNPLVMLAFAILAPVAAGVIQMAISRSREYEADRSAARLLNDGDALARALEKLHGYSGTIPSHVNPAQASQYIVNPLTNRKVSFANLFSTHPPAEDRIKRLRSGEWRDSGF
jgi:heat shock protein HtpX